MSGPDTRAVEAAEKARQEKQAKAEFIEKVLENPQDANADELSTFFSTASDEEKAELLDSYGLDVDEFYDNVERAIGDYQTDEQSGPLREQTFNGGTTKYESENVIERIRQNSDLTEDLLQKFIVSKSNTFDDFLASEAGNIEVESYINELLDRDTGFFAQLFGRPVTIEEAGPKDTARRLSGDLGPAPADDEATEKKAEDISDSTAKQCVLLNLLNPLSKLCDKALKEKCASPNGGINGLPYSGRILKLDTANPTTLMNYLSNVPGINNNLTDLVQQQNATNSADNMAQFYRLSLIKKHNGSLVELPVLFKGKFNYNTISGDNVGFQGADSDGAQTQGTSYNNIAVDDAKDKRAGQVRQTSTPNETSQKLIKPSNSLGNFVKDELTDFKVDITYQGSNPSTYRNDVDVTVSFTAPTLNTFLKSWTYEGIKDGDDPINFNLFDLILFPYLEKNAEGYGKAYKSQYSPNYNRIRLAYASGFRKTADRTDDFVTFFENNSNVLDLAVVDHEIKREEEGTRYVLSITYKGYVQSVLTSPETDMLSTPDIKTKRARRDQLLKAAIEKDCSLREIQKIQSQLNRLAQNDVKDVSSGLLTKLFDRKEDSLKGLGIYKLNFDQTLARGLRDAGGGINTDAVKKRIVNPDNGPIVRDTNNVNVSALVQGDNTLESITNKDNKQIYFFYLADLLDTAILNSGIFSNKNSIDDPINKDQMPQKMRFIMGSFTDPEDYVINIGNIPISVDFFLDWYQENVTKKELFIYPCLSFIRDIAEKVVTNMINNVCFEGLEETKLLVRTSFLTGTALRGRIDPIFTKYKFGFAESSDGNVNLDDMFLPDSDLPLIKTNFRSNILEYINYCTIFTRENNRARNLERNVEVPEFKLEYQPSRFGVAASNFSRTQQTNLRESRYFRNSQSGITMLASVYNVDLDLTHPIHFIYPGQFFKINIADTVGLSQITVGNTTRSIFSELGLNGYYAVNKVTTSIDARTEQIKTKISGIFIGSDSPYSVRDFDSTQASLEDSPPSPQEVACSKYVELSNEIGLLELGSRGSFLEQLIEEVSLSIPSEQPETASDAGGEEIPAVVPPEDQQIEEPAEPTPTPDEEQGDIQMGAVG